MSPCRDANDLKELMDQFAELTVAAGEAIERGDAKANRAAARKVKSLVDKISKSGGSNWRLEFRTLLEHPSPWVRGWAAVEAFDMAPIEAVKAIRRILLEERGPVTIGAEHFLVSRKIATR